MLVDLAKVFDILDAAEVLHDVAARLTYTELPTRKTEQYAIRGCFQVIGEAARSISLEIRSEHPEIPWKKLTGKRHRIVHDYDRLNWNIVWDTMLNDIPLLIKQLRPLLPPPPPLASIPI